MNDDPGVPSDHTTLTAVLDEYASAGYTGHFEVVSESAITCLTCQEDSAPPEVAMAGLRRLEGASDPADMMSVSLFRARAVEPSVRWYWIWSDGLG